MIIDNEENNIIGDASLLNNNIFISLINKFNENDRILKQGNQEYNTYFPEINNIYINLWRGFAEVALSESINIDEKIDDENKKYYNEGYQNGIIDGYNSCIENLEEFEKHNQFVLTRT